MKILCVFGTRPEAIKMAPVIQALAQRSYIELKVCVTGQHKEMLYQVLNIFNIKPDFDLELMSKNQSLNGLMSRIIAAIDPVLESESPDWVLVHGDTTTSTAAALAAFHRKIRIAHVEAGLRTHDLTQPWPEEMNRRVTDSISEMLFPPTQKAKKNLLSEGLGDRAISVTGNTVIDALLYTSRKLNEDKELSQTIRQMLPPISLDRRVLLVTGHRRENFGRGFEQVCRALVNLSQRKDIHIIYPVHLNPNVKGVVGDMLANIGNIDLIDPLDYLPFVWLMQNSYVVLTDSGGVQEEAPSLGKPVLVMRDVTERPEAVEAGTVKLVGTVAQNIVESVNNLYDNADLYRKFAFAINPYGDGQASERIVAALEGTDFSEFVATS